MDRIRERSLAEEQVGLGARLVGIAAGAWLFASAFLWPHTETQRGNCMVVGFVIAAVAAIGGRATQVRFVHAVAAAWLFLSGFALRSLTPDTIVSDVFVAIVVFTSSVTGHAPHADAARVVRTRDTIVRN